MTKILAFAGSSRKESFNKKLVRIAAAGAEQAGARVTVIDLADFSMPVYNHDLELEQGLPEHAREFKKLMIEHDGFLIASPEYNSAFSPLLKNVIDWASRREMETEPPLAAFRGKVAAIMATSPGALGGIRGLVFLRMLLSNLGVLVIPEQQAVAYAGKVFTDDGSLADDKQKQVVMDLGGQLTQRTKQLRNVHEIT